MAKNFHQPASMIVDILQPVLADDPAGRRDELRSW
jgi:hypothetical protein